MTYQKFNPTSQTGGAPSAASSDKKDHDLLASLGGGDKEMSLEMPASLADSQAEPEAQAEYVPKHTSSGSGGVTSNVEERALSLLGSGIRAEQVAAALGVTPARIAQLLSEEHFSKQVADLRYNNLQKHNIRDEAYDNLEDSLLGKLKSAMPLLIKPRDIIDALTKVNAAKRRGQSAPASVTNQQNVVALILPTVIAEKFAIDINNQVTKAGSQDLLTMPSGNLLEQVEAAAETRELGHTEIIKTRVGNLLDKED